MDALDDIKNRLNIEDVIGEYVQLKRAGRNWKGLSPFSEERSPSFMVSPEKQIWHDFSSGKGGNIFSFIMEVEGLEFKEALELLARKAGVDLSLYRRSSEHGNRTSGDQKERLYQLLDLSTKFYQVQFSHHQVALTYVLKKRGFSKETALEWRLGYAPNSSAALLTFLKAKGFSEAEMKAAGVISQRYQRASDMFRGRLMIPLADAQGRIIGFTARILTDDPNAPKYINTPQTVLYDKSRHVFGLHMAKETIRKSGFAVVAEGNLDVIASHQAGVRQVVATAGTALTEYHLKALSRFTGDIRLSFDADKAGLNATERAIPIASKVKVSLSIISIPTGKDPDELIKQNVQTWKNIIQHPQYALDWLIERYQQLLDIHSAQGKRQFSDIILQVVNELQDVVEQDHYINKVAELIAISPEALRLKLQQTSAVAGQQQRPRPLKKTKLKMARPAATEFDSQRTQNHLLSLALMQPKLRPIILEPLTAEMFNDGPSCQLLLFLQEHPEFNGQAKYAEILQPIADYVKILGLHYEELYQNLEFLELQNEVARLQVHLIDRYVKTQKQLITAELHEASQDQTRQLLQRAKELDGLLKTYQGGM